MPFFVWHLPEHMREATENVTDLLMEVQSFWVEPALHNPRLDDYFISHIAVGVVCWLRVRLISYLLVKLILNGRCPFRSFMTHQRN